MLLLDFEGCKTGELKVLTANMLTVATLLISNTWKSAEIPLISEWLGKIRYMGLISKISAMGKYRTGRRNTLEKFQIQREPFLLS